MANVKKPMGKLLSLWLSVETHIHTKAENVHVVPEHRPLQCCKKNVLVRAFHDHRKCLLKVTSEDDSDTPKGTIV